METKNMPETSNLKKEGNAGFIKTKYFNFVEPPEEFILENLQKISPVKIAYETYGRLNEEKNNAILVFHALSGDAHAAGFHTADDKKPGWWDIMIGPGKPFDTDKYFIICSNVIGGCKGSTGPSSINPATGKPYGLTFPQITIKDMLVPQRALVQYLKIEKLLCVAGGSMGGMQALQWVVSYPEMSEAAIIIATAPEHSAQQIALNSIGRYAIISDPKWKKGNYYQYKNSRPDIGLSIARMIGHITYLSEEAMHKKFGRDVINRKKEHIMAADFTKDFEVENYLQHQGETFIKRFDANSYLYITKAIDNFNISKSCNNLAEALKNVKSKCLIVSFASDWLYPREQSLKIVRALKINGVETNYINYNTSYGHDAFLIEDPEFKAVLKGFIKSINSL